MSEPYEIRYAASAVADVRALRAFDQRKLLDAIGRHLTFQPKLASKSRIKLMVQPFWSQYRLRLDDFRVYYDVDEGSRRVHVLRVPRKTTGPTPEESP
jgi:mRNA interferase RelE/StbE